jgi:hypothetical protein
VFLLKYVEISLHADHSPSKSPFRGDESLLSDLQPTFVCPLRNSFQVCGYFLLNYHSKLQIFEKENRNKMYRALQWTCPSRMHLGLSQLFAAVCFNYLPAICIGADGLAKGSGFLRCDRRREAVVVREVDVAILFVG